MITALNAHAVSNYHTKNHASAKSRRYFLVACLVAAFVLLALLFGGVQASKMEAGKCVSMYQIVKRPQPKEEGCYSSQVSIRPPPQFEKARGIEELREQIATSKWGYAVNPAPRLPQKRNCIKQDEIDALHRYAAGKIETNLIMRALNQTLTVAHRDFEALLSHSTAKLNRYLKKQEPSQREFVVTFPRAHKSQRWAFELALKYLQFWPTDVVRQFDLRASLARHKNVRHIVMFDDALYSCTQMTNAVTMIYDDFAPIIFHAVVPFVSDRNCIRQKMQSAAKIPKAHELIIHTSVEFGQALDVQKLFLNDEEKDVAIERGLLNEYKGPYKNTGGIHTLVFDHKLADSHSIPRRIYTQVHLYGFVYFFLDNPRPPYKDEGVSTF